MNVNKYNFIVRLPIRVYKFWLWCVQTHVWVSSACAACDIVLCLLDYRFLYNYCPGPEWSVMCRGCCEYDVIHCKCPLQGYPVGYAVPCCRNAANECDPCIIHPGEQITHKHAFSVFFSCDACLGLFMVFTLNSSYIFNTAVKHL